MSIDLSKLSPAPWFGDESYLVRGTDRNGEELAKFDGLNDRNANCAFAALARNALDVMLRRGWSVVFDEVNKLWSVHGTDTPLSIVAPAMFAVQSDPFTALVEADKWYAENVEAKP